MKTETTTTAATADSIPTSGTTPDTAHPWSYTAPPTVFTTIHILAEAPTITFYRSTYPTVAIRELGGTDAIANVRLTLTGDEAQRAAFTAALRDVADAIDGWTK